jgi:hypothetical protein
LEFSFAGDKEPKVAFFVCKRFDSIRGIRHNKYGMVEIKHNAELSGNDDFILAHQVEHVYYLKYPCEKLVPWRVVYKVNPRKWLYTPTNSAYHFDVEHVDEIYQEEELPTFFCCRAWCGTRFLSRRWCRCHRSLEIETTTSEEKCTGWSTL